MIIYAEGSGPAVLRDPWNFSTFKVVCASRVADRGIALRGVGRLNTKGGFIWVDRRWLLAQGPAGEREWINGLETMTAFAAKHGWLGENGAIRAHIEDEPAA